MNLKQFISMFGSKQENLRDNDYYIVQLAFEDVVDKLSLELHLFVAVIDKAFRTNGLKSFNWIGNKPVAFKGLKAYGANVISADTSIPIVNELELYEFLDDIPNELLDSANEGQTKTPDIQVKGDIVQVSNVETKAILYLYGYAIPYFVSKAVDDDIKVNCYSIVDMVNQYDEESLNVDEALIALMIPKILAIIEAMNGNVGLSSNHEYFYTQMLNMFNARERTFRNDEFTGIDLQFNAV